MSRLLAIRPGGLGDCILSFPAIESLRERCQYLEVWVPRPVVPLIKFADRVRAISETGLDLFGLPGIDPDPKLIESLKTFDAIVSWYGTNREDFRSATARVGLPIEFHTALPPPSSPLHAGDYFSTQLGAPIGATPHIVLDRLQPSPYLAIHPFSGSPKKNWTLDRFDALAHALPVPVQWCATPEQALERAPLLAVDDLLQVAHWLVGATLYIGNDSGLTHLAAAVGTPVIALFGASNPRIWAPLGHQPIEVIAAPSMEAIGVDAVVAAATRLLR